MGRVINCAAGAVLLFLGLLAGPAAQAVQEDEFYRTAEEVTPYEAWLAAVEKRVRSADEEYARPGPFDGTGEKYARPGPFNGTETYARPGPFNGTGDKYARPGPFNGTGKYARPGPFYARPGPFNGTGKYARPGPFYARPGPFNGTGKYARPGPFYARPGPFNGTGKYARPGPFNGTGKYARPGPFYARPGPFNGTGDKYARPGPYYARPGPFNSTGDKYARPGPYYARPGPFNGTGEKYARPGPFFDPDVSVNLEDGDVTMFVDLAGKGKYKKVQDAVDAIQPDLERTSRVVIKLNPGIYFEQIIIPEDKPYVTLQGSGQWNTKISWKEGAAAQISGAQFTALDILFENTSPAPNSGAVEKQATALAISGDMAAFVRVGFFGFQETLYDGFGRHYFQDVYIHSSINVIYGDGLSYYTNSELHVVPVPVRSLTAEKKQDTDEYTGFSFVGCKVTGEGYVYLGRAWLPASRTVFSHTYLAEVVLPEDWMDWEDSSRDKSIFYGEYENYGPGASKNGRVSYSHDLSASQAKPFQTINFIDGIEWLWDAGIGKI